MQSSPPIEGNHYSSQGTILEAAFVDPAYSWPPSEGQGKNAIELQASAALLEDKDDSSVKTTESLRQRMTLPTKPKHLEQVKKKSFFGCCQSTDAAMMDLKEYETAKRSALKARKEHYTKKKAHAKAIRKKSRFNAVPEGILIYRLDTCLLYTSPSPRD